jgi:hypothetical protein
MMDWLNADNWQLKAVMYLAGCCYEASVEFILTKEGSHTCAISILFSKKECILTFWRIIEIGAGKGFCLNVACEDTSQGVKKLRCIAQKENAFVPKLPVVFFKL